MLRNLAKRLHGGHPGHALPDLEAMLPDAVGGRPLLTWSVRGADYLADTSLAPDEAEELKAVLAADGLSIDDIGMAVAGRSDVAADPPYFVHVFRFRGVPAEMLAPEIGVTRPTAGAWTPLTIGVRTVRVGTEAMVPQSEDLRGRPYVYEVGDVRFIVTAADAAWAAEAITHLQPDPLVERVPLLVGLPLGWRAGLQPTALEAAVASVRDDPDVIAVAHDSTRLDRTMVPTLRIETKGRLEPGADLGAWLDTQEAVFRDAMAAPQPEGRIVSVDRVLLPAGDAIRVELVSDPDSRVPLEVGGVQYFVPTEVGVFALWFACEAGDLPGYRTTFARTAATFLRADLYPDDYVERFERAFGKNA